MSDHLTRKELKQDTAALALDTVFHNMAGYRDRLVKYGGAVVAVALIAGLTVYYRGYQSGLRQQALGDAIVLQGVAIGTPATPGGPSFPTEAAKKEAIVKAYTKILADHAGSDEGYIATYTLAAIDAENGKFADAKKKYQEVADSGGKEYGSMARLALAQIAFGEDKVDDARKILKDLADNPTSMVSKNQANYILARGISAKQPAEARKLLVELADTKSEISQVAVTALGELPPQ